MQERAPDAVDLMLEGRLDDAIQEYLTLYSEAVEERNWQIGPDLIAQLLYCFALRQEGSSPEKVSSQVAEHVADVLHRKGVTPDGRRVDDDLELALGQVRAAKRAAGASVKRAQKEKDQRWQGV